MLCQSERSVVEDHFNALIKANHERIYYYGRHPIAIGFRAGGNLKALALRLFISFPCFKGIHEHSLVPNQVGNDDSSQPIKKRLLIF